MPLKSYLSPQFPMVPLWNGGPFIFFIQAFHVNKIIGWEQDVIFDGELESLWLGKKLNVPTIIYACKIKPDIFFSCGNSSSILPDWHIKHFAFHNAGIHMTEKGSVVGKS